jgi:hypothetical protein
MCLIEQFVLSGDGEMEVMDDNNAATTNDNAQQPSTSNYVTTASVQHAAVGSDITEVVSADEQASVCFVHATTTLTAVR